MPVSIVIAYRRRPQSFGLDLAATAEGVEHKLLRRTRLHCLPDVMVEEAQRLVEHLDVTMPRADSWVLGLTGPGLGEGVSTVACCVSVALAARSRGRVLLVDGSARSPLLADDDGAGLAELLLGEREPAEVIEPLAGSDISILPWGNADRDVSGRVDASRVRGVLEDLRGGFPYIVIDLPPPALEPYSLNLASACHGVGVVVGAHRTDRAAVQHTAAMLRAASVSLVGAVFNRTSRR
ncbi:MAG: hypothetical protein IT179_01850 [Acidobacteria bacterium]|nr:hypothetical protein [Acidobacteriota bacterium]